MPNGTVKRSTKIAHETGGGPTLADQDFFGFSLTSLGDFDGDGAQDLAVGAAFHDPDGSNYGVVYVLLMSTDGTAKGSQIIEPGIFASSLASPGDLDGDGLGDLAVGTQGEGNYGAVHVLFLNADGTLKRSEEISHQRGGGPTLSENDFFGSSLASLGDLDGDGVGEIAVGATDAKSAGRAGGAVFVLFMEPDVRSIDFGDAPDSGPGTGEGNYNTLSTDSGPGHTVVAGLFMGAKRRRRT